MNTTNTFGKKFSPIGSMFMNCSTNGAWKLGDIKPTEGSLNPTTEYLQQFNPTTGAILDTKYVYIDETTAAKVPFSMWKGKGINPVGWWVKPTGSFAPTGPTTDRADDVTIEPGEGFYTNFGNANARLNFPASITSL